MPGGSKRAPIWVGGWSEKVSLEIILKAWRMRESWHVVWGLGKGGQCSGPSHLVV